MDGKTILLVEDNLDDIELTLRAFEKGKITSRTVIARDGVEALDYIFASGAYTGRDTADAPAVILLDLNLPRIDGIEVLKRVRADARVQHIPIVILTSSRSDRDRRESYSLGANSYIQKPVDFEYFSELARQIILYWLVLNQPPPSVD